MKKGQITIFIIIGILILVFVGVFIFLLSNKNDERDSNQNIIDTEEYQKIQDCVEYTSNTAIYFNLLQGGYYNVEGPYLEYYPIKIAYYWRDDESNLPSLKKIEYELSKLVKDNIKTCLKGYDIDRVTTNVKILNKTIIFDYDIPIKIKNENSVIEFVKFEEKVNIDFYEKYFFVKDFLDIQSDNKGEFPLSKLMDLAYENDFKFEILEIDDDIKVISIIFDPIDERGYVAYNFAMQHNYNYETNL